MRNLVFSLFTVFFLSVSQPGTVQAMPNSGKGGGMPPCTKAVVLTIPDRIDVLLAKKFDQTITAEELFEALDFAEPPVSLKAKGLISKIWSPAHTEEMATAFADEIGELVFTLASIKQIEIRSKSRGGCCEEKNIKNLLLRLTSEIESLENLSIKNWINYYPKLKEYLEQRADRTLLDRSFNAGDSFMDRLELTKGELQEVLEHIEAEARAHAGIDDAELKISPTLQYVRDQISEIIQNIDRQISRIKTSKTTGRPRGQREP